MPSFFIDKIELGKSLSDVRAVILSACEKGQRSFGCERKVLRNRGINQRLKCRHRTEPINRIRSRHRDSVTGSGCGERSQLSARGEAHDTDPARVKPPFRSAAPHQAEGSLHVPELSTFDGVG